MSKVEICYPNFTKKAITFSIDDGHVTYDSMLLDIVRPAGILGTFNLCSDRQALTPDEYRALYDGYEIANHCKYHPHAFADGVEYDLSDEIYDENTAIEGKVYRHASIPNMYIFCRAPGRWRRITDADTYVELIKAGRRELEEIFGKGSVTGYVWPFFEQESALVQAYLREAGYYSVRKTGALRDSTGFNFYEDPMRWSYNASHSDLLEVAELYDKYPDDGRLKVFCFGVHSVDFERADKWGDLRRFAELYGGRPTDFWYATVRDIFAYNMAAAELVVSDAELRNESSLTLYIKVDGKHAELLAGETYKLV